MRLTTYSLNCSLRGLQVATVDPDGWKYVFVDHADFLKELETATGGEL